MASSLSSNTLKGIRALSLDITGTLLVHKYPIMETYAKCALQAKLPFPPTAAELKQPFKQAYQKNLIESPCFGYDEGLSSRDWWVRTVKSALQFASRSYTEEEFNRFFRLVYQHYGSLDGYEILPDTNTFLAAVGQCFPMGITTNTPIRSIETVLPMLGLHKHFDWFVCCRDIGVEKPGVEIFEATYQKALFIVPDLQRQEMLHIGDSFAADYCGAKAAGFQALHIDRSENPRVTVYQDWLKAPDYLGKSEEDIKKHTVKDLNEVASRLDLNASNSIHS